jgi:uncharacterized membrane protein YhaH (DUF805 family)
MIYKFIDENGSEITVNSLSSLQALVESETIKKNTKVKAGLRGKWTTAEEITDLVFLEDKIIEEDKEEKEDIKSFLIKEEKEENKTSKTNEEIPNNKEVKKESSDEELVEKNKEPDVEPENKDDEADDKTFREEEINNEDQKKDVDEQDPDEDEKTAEEIEAERLQNIYADSNVEGLNFFDSIKICFKKTFIYQDRASRSEFWYFSLIYTILSIPIYIYENSYDPTEKNLYIISVICVIILFLPGIAVQIRRMHDINKSGWFILLNLVPFIGSIIVLVMLIEKGTLGKNRFGEYPLKLIEKNPKDKSE